MPVQQGVGGTELGQDVIVGHGRMISFVQKAVAVGGRFVRGGFARCTIVLEMLEASGKRVYSAREIQLVRQPPRSVLRLCADGRIRSEEHTSELQSLMRISYAVFCLKKKIKQE